MTSIISQPAADGVKKINEGLPLDKDELKLFSRLFVENKYFAHLKFGLINGRIDPEELLYRVDENILNKVEFIYFLTFLIKNGLDVNYYFTGPFGIKIHLVVFIIQISGENNEYNNYICDLLKSSGSNFGLMQSNKSSDTIEYYLKNNGIKTDNLPDIPIKRFLNQGRDVTYYPWEKLFRPVLLDTDNEEGNIMEKISRASDLEKSYLMNIICTVGSGGIITKLKDECIFLNKFLSMRQSIYFAINSQNYEIFNILMQKGLLCNYVELTELICRHNMASEAKDSVLKKTYTKMLLDCIQSGSEIDSSQLKLLSLHAEVETIMKIKEFYSEPEWRKLCNRTNFSKNDISNYKIRRIAFDLNIDFSLPSHKICEKLEKINNMDRLEYINSFIMRQEDRAARSLLEIGELRPDERLEKCRCDKRTMILNNPYAYNDARMAFYKSEIDGNLWCFTSDMFTNLQRTEVNPYTGDKLPELFLETISSQLNILESLDLKPDKDMRTITETLEDVFDKKHEINNKKSEEIYNSFIILYRLSTGFEEEDFRNLSIQVNSNGVLFKNILTIYFNLFVDCKNKMKEFNSYTGEKINISKEEEYLLKTNIEKYTGSTYSIFEGAKFIEKIGLAYSGELYYKVLSHILKDLCKRVNTNEDYSGNSIMKLIFKKLDLAR